VTSSCRVDDEWMMMGGVMSRYTSEEWVSEMMGVWMMGVWMMMSVMDDDE